MWACMGDGEGPGVWGARTSPPSAPLAPLPATRHHPTSVLAHPRAPPSPLGRYQQYWATDASELLNAKKGEEARRLAHSKAPANGRGAGTTPGAGARGSLGRPPLTSAAGDKAGGSSSGRRAGAPGVAAIMYGKGGVGEDPLVAARRKKQLEQAALAVLPTRHSRFGSQFIVKGVANRCVATHCGCRVSGGGELGQGVWVGGEVASWHVGVGGGVGGGGCVWEMGGGGGRGKTRFL